MGDDAEESSTDEAALDQSHAASTPVAQATHLERARAASEAGHPILTIVVFWLALIWGLAFYIRGYHSYGRWEPWNVGDWLIGYQDGFVRRGLIGQVVFELGRHGPKIPPPASIFFLQVVLVLLSAIGITILARTKRDRWLPWILLSPAGLLFFITNRRFIVTSKLGGYILKNFGAGGMRKEILLFVIVVALALAVRRRSGVRRTLVVLALVAYVVEMLSWEAAAFFLPIVLLLLLAALKDETRGLRRAAAGLLIALSAGGLLLSVVAPGNAAQANVICHAYHQWGAPTRKMCNGAIFALSDSLSSQVHQVGTNFPHYLLYVLTYALCLVPFALSGWLARHWRLFLIVVAASLPLYFIGTDYGRWIHTTIVLLTVHWLVLDERTEPPRDFVPFWVRDILLIPWFGAWSLPYFSIPIKFGGLFAQVGHSLRRLVSR